MKSYFLRRLLLIPPTLLGITLLVFTVTRFMPGGPMDRMLQQAAATADQGGKRSNAVRADTGPSEEEIERNEEKFGTDKPILHAYCQWLGALPRETQISKGEFTGRSDETIGGASGDDQTTVIVLRFDGRQVRVQRDGDKIKQATFVKSGKDITEEGWKIRYESNADRQARYQRRYPDRADSPPTYTPRAVIYKTRFSGILQGNLGESSSYNDPVDQMILSRMPVAIYFGLLTAFLTYAVCLPLGVLKAIKHRTLIDTSSSILIFLGYSIPGFALGAILIVHLGARMNLFPLFGLTSADFDQMNTFEKIKDLAHHTVLPLLCYMVGSFAMLTMMVKNNLMDNLAADYVRTAVAKGASFKRAVFGHAFRNSMIPIATSLGQLVTIFVGGSMLIERVFDIQGFGLLQFQAVVERDEGVIMGTLSIAALLMLVGNVISDIIVAMVDPRIKFD